MGCFPRDSLYIDIVYSGCPQGIPRSIVELYIIVFVEIKYKILIAFLQKYLRATIG